MVYKISLLGPLTVKVNQTKVRFTTQSSIGLLAYVLMAPGQSCSRMQLATLLWPEQNEEKGLNNLRVTLNRLRKAIKTAAAKTTLPELVVGDRWTISINESAEIEFDINLCNQLLEKENALKNLAGIRHEIRWQEALFAFNQGDFLSGLQISSPQFNEWVEVERALWQFRMMRVGESLTENYLRLKAPEKTITIGRKLLLLDSTNEVAHQQLIKAYLLMGRWLDAVKQYHACREVLAQIWQTTPVQATTDLYEEAQAGRLNGIAAPNLSQKLALPLAPTPFFGRKNEVQQLASRLLDQGERLISIVGGGGFGKSRLSIEAGRRVAAYFPDGVWFVPLSNILPTDDAETQIAILIAQTLGINIDRNRPILGQLLSNLADKELLLICDNFEHLLNGVSIVDQLLEKVPKSALLVTSREPLRLSAELVMRLEGMSVPLALEDEAHDFAVIQLFADRARRVEPSFLISGDNLPAVVNICQKLWGQPLAVELAAGWVTHYTLAEITAQIDQDIDFLQTRHRFIDQRHANLRQVYETSWGLLTPSQQLLLAHLAVFEGEFSRQAALTVGQSDLETLISLVDKSMVHQVSPGQYDLHKIIREFSAEKFPQTRPERIDRYVHYFATQLDQANSAYRQNDLQLFLDLNPLLPELANAFLHAIKIEALPLVDQYLRYLYIHHIVAGRENEGLLLWQQAHRHMQANWPTPLPAEHQAIQTKLLLRMGGFKTFCGQLTDAKQTLEALESAVETLDDSVETAIYYGNLGQAYNRLGLKDKFVEIEMKRVSMFDPKDVSPQHASALNGLGQALSANGQFNEAHEAYAKTLPLHKQLGSEINYSIALANIGRNAMLNNDLETARSTLRESLTYRLKSGNPHRIASVLTSLGDVANAEGNFAEARDFHQRALETFRKTGRAEMITQALNGLAIAALGLEDFETAETCLSSAATQVLQIQSESIGLDVIYAWANFYLMTEKASQAAALHRFVAQHDSAHLATRRKAEARLQDNAAVPEPLHNNDWQTVLSLLLAKTGT